MLCCSAMSPTARLRGFPRLFGKPVVLNVDGLDRRRGKWNALGQAALHVLRVDVDVHPDSRGD